MFEPSTFIQTPGAAAPMRVLLADDHVESAVAGGRLLQPCGYDVRVALDGFEAITRAAAFRPDAIVLDLSLPVLDGFDVARRLRAMHETRDCLIIAMTGWASSDVEMLARAAGCDLYLVKP